MGDRLTLTLVDEFDRDDPARRVGVAASALDRVVGISNTTERAVRIVVDGDERVLWPSPRRGESLVVGVLLWRVGDGDDFDFRAVGEPCLVEQPVELDGLCAELLWPGGVPGVY